MVMLLLVLVVIECGKHGSNDVCCGRGCCQCKVPVCHVCHCVIVVVVIVY